jgi:hypothetical protein
MAEAGAGIRHHGEAYAPREKLTAAPWLSIVRAAFQQSHF